MGRSTPDNAESELFRLETSPSHLIHRAEQLAADRFAELAQNALTLRQFAVLAAVAGEPGLSQISLVRRTGIDRSTLADLVSRLQKRGLLTRAAAVNDARALAVDLTPAGTTALAGMTRHARAADAAILDLLPKSKRRSFLGLLRLLAELAEKQAERAEREAKRQAKRENRARRDKKAEIAVAAKPGRKPRV